MKYAIPGEVLLKRKRTEILIDKKKAGTVYDCDFDCEKGKVFVTDRNGNLILKKTGYTLGISMAVLNRVRDLHNVKYIIIRYLTEKRDYQYFFTNIQEWYDSEIVYWWGTDEQKHIPISKLRDYQPERVK